MTNFPLSLNPTFEYCQFLCILIYPLYTHKIIFEHPRFSMWSWMFKVQESPHLYRCVVQMCCADVFDRLYSVINTGCLNREQERSMEMSPNNEKDLEVLHLRYRLECTSCHHLLTHPS